MGIYDREYYREEQREERPGFNVHWPRTVIGSLVAINIAIYIVGQLLLPSLSDFLAIHSAPNPKIPPEYWQWPETLMHPWLWWQLVAYGFAHASNPSHVAFNMLGLWFLGRDIETVYGKREFLRLYLTALFVGGLFWAVMSHAQGLQRTLCYGASGAVAAIVVLYACHFPRRTLLLFFVLPVPAWLCGVFLVLCDIFGALGGKESGGNVAYTVHLAGAAFALAYYKFHWNLGRLTGWSSSLPRLRPRPKLQIHDPEKEYADLSSEVDRILEKIHVQGEASLTRKERRTLEDASREFQRRRQDSDVEDK
jgi:membrane associated rhomboid family serine protease